MDVEVDAVGVALDLDLDCSRRGEVGVAVEFAAVVGVGVVVELVGACKVEADNAEIDTADFDACESEGARKGNQLDFSLSLSLSFSLAVGLLGPARSVFASGAGSACPSPSSPA